jgi:hypothetical protein
MVPALANQHFAWPTMIAAALGLWRLQRSALSPRLTLLAYGWGGSCLVFLVIGLISPLDLRYHLAAFPLLAILAGLAISWAWQQHAPVRIAAWLIACSAVWLGLRPWMGMLN